ncbi:hypothetical protein [Stenotrophomonas acidaminiphila]|uniref:hypothetical protein n=1 Tax=Stenotrophomonas acidaminiphila TaxID=128780 RepID=UPI0028A98798|nr:hypothetical protein [Stenotrophomonas acidaminiphila]
MAGTKIKLKDQLGRVVRVGGDGTNGATVGKDLRWPDGSLVQESQVRNSGGQAGGSSGSSTGGSTGGIASTVWRLVREVPANLQRLAALVGAGLTVRGSDGAWHQRSIAAGEGIQVENADGVAGDPVVSLAPLVRPAAATVSALRLVSEGADGVRHLDPTDAASVAGMLGISITAGDAGSAISIKAGGSIDDAGWSWSPGFVFAAPSGALTQVPPTTGWEIVVGYAPAPTRLNLTFDEPVKLA